MAAMLLPDSPALHPADGLAAEPAVLTVDELALLLRVDRKTAYAAVTRGEVPGVRRLGRTIRVHRESVITWLRDGHGAPARARRAR